MGELLISIVVVKSSSEIIYAELVNVTKKQINILQP